MLVNTDRYLLLSGQRNYFYHQKEFYLNEIKRITEIYDRCHFKKKNYKKRLVEIKENMDLEISRLEKEVQYLRDKVKIGDFLFNFFILNEVSTICFFLF